MIKTATSLEQSKKLVKLGIDTNSADMVLLHEEPYETSDSMFDGLHQYLCVLFSIYDKGPKTKYRNISYFPAWSLSALFELIPTTLLYNDNLVRLKMYKDINSGYALYYEDLSTEFFVYLKSEGNNLIDVCVDLIIKLKENKCI